MKPIPRNIPIGKIHVPNIQKFQIDLEQTKSRIPKSRSGTPAPDVPEPLFMKSNWELRKIAMPLLLRQQHPWRAVRILFLSIIPLAVIFAFISAKFHGGSFFVFIPGMICGGITSTIFKTAARPIQFRYRFLAGFLAVTIWGIFYLSFLAFIPHNAEFRIILLARRSNWDDVIRVITPWSKVNAIFLSDILAAFWIAFATGVRKTFTRNELYHAAQRVLREQEGVK